MGTALHLAEVHQAPPGPKRKRKGGGGNGSAFYEYAQRIYADERADAPARELLLAVAFAITTVPGDGHEQWALVRRALGPSRTHRSRVAELAERDVPRYVPPEHQRGGNDPAKRRCQGPRVRPYRSRGWEGMTAAERAAVNGRDAEDFRNVLGICGEGNTESVLEKLPGTGWYKMHYFCPRHRDHLLRIRAQVAEQNLLAPQPIPNVGGLLPSYFDADWMKLYRWCRGDSWQPPVYGIRADDWPVPGKEPVPQRARLRLAALDGELLGGA